MSEAKVGIWTPEGEKKPDEDAVIAAIVVGIGWLVIRGRRRRRSEAVVAKQP